MSTITIEQSSGNVYADLGMADAQEMLVKAKLAAKIGEIIKRQNLTQQQAAEVLAMPQPKVSLLLRGQFRGISEAKMLECLARLGRDIDSRACECGVCLSCSGIPEQFKAVCG
jgi:predicted XRE-type DNA-binding protein